jgi:hypothetical protein
MALFRRKQPDPLVIFAPSPRGDIHHRTTINQQPNDPADAARLYGELLEKARAEVINAMVQEIPSIDAKLVTFAMQRDHESFNDIIGIVFNVNGHAFKETIKIDIDQARVARTVIEKISEAIAGAVLRQMERDLIKAGMR